MAKRIFCILFILLMLGGSFAGAQGELFIAQGESVIDGYLEEMTLRDKIYQMMMVDFRLWGESASTAEDLTVINDEVRNIVKEHNFGAVLYFANNLKSTEQVFELTRELQNAAMQGGAIPMMIAVDQEGGSVYRLGSGTALPGNMALGATYAKNGTKYAYEAGRIIGSELSVLGINTDLAPVVDVNSDPNNPVIGLRSYSDQPSVVGELAAAQIEGMAQYNVIGCAKHFPGHGDTDIDSHYGLPLVDKSLDQLEQCELKPFEVAIDKGVEMIMTAHILYPQLEKDKVISVKTGQEESLPATMSDDILTRLLKKDMGFEGIVITDAMTMAGISDKWELSQASIIAINAGADMLCMADMLYCKQDVEKLESIADAIEAAVNGGEISISRIDDAVSRILKVKQNRGILDHDPLDLSFDKAIKTVGCEENRNMEREIASAAITVVRDKGVLPLKVGARGKVLMLVPDGAQGAQMIMGWNRAKERGVVPVSASVELFCFEDSDKISQDLRKKLDWADSYIIISQISDADRMDCEQWQSAMPDMLCNYAAQKGKTAVVISADKPYDVQLYSDAAAMVAAYGRKGSELDAQWVLTESITAAENACGPNIIAAVEAVFGVYTIQGKLPLDVYAYDKESGSYTDQVLYSRGYGIEVSAAPVYTVSFNAGGGAGSMKQGLTGGEYLLPTCSFTPPKGKRFKAWEVLGKQKDVSAIISLTESITVTALWEDVPQQSITDGPTDKPTDIPTDKPTVHPNEGHKHRLMLVDRIEPTCTDNGRKEHYRCDCGKLFEDELGASEITDIDGWGKLEALGHIKTGIRKDKDGHYRECAVKDCGAVLDREAHFDKDGDGLCDVCAYELEAGIDPAVPPGEGGSLWAVPVAAVVCCLTVLAISKKRK